MWLKVGLALCLAVAGAADAATIDVQMRNQGEGGAMVFSPAFVRARLGDVIHFVPTDPGHNAETIPGMLPSGAVPVAGTVGRSVDLPLTKAGLYGIECKPHLGLGMVALIKAGDGPAPNATVAASVKLPPLATRRMAPLLAAAR